MVRHIEPQLTKTETSEPFDRKERVNLALFLGELQEHPDLMKAILGEYSRTSEVVAAARQLSEDDQTSNATILRATAGVFETNVDAKLRADDFTRHTARIAINQALRRGEVVDPDRRRMAHTQTFVGEIAAWNAVYGMFEGVVEGFRFGQVLIDGQRSPAMRLLSTEAPVQAPGAELEPESRVLFAVPHPGQDITVFTSQPDSVA
jgi:hypothetical protein